METAIGVTQGVLTVYNTHTKEPRGGKYNGKRMTVPPLEGLAMREEIALILLRQDLVFEQNSARDHNSKNMSLRKEFKEPEQPDIDIHTVRAYLTTDKTVFDTAVAEYGSMRDAPQPAPPSHLRDRIDEAIPNVAGHLAPLVEDAQNDTPDALHPEDYRNTLIKTHTEDGVEILRQVDYMNSRMDSQVERIEALEQGIQDIKEMIKGLSSRPKPRINKRRGKSAKKQAEQISATFPEV